MEQIINTLLPCQSMMCCCVILEKSCYGWGYAVAHPLLSSTYDVHSLIVHVRPLLSYIQTLYMLTHIHYTTNHTVQGLGLYICTLNSSQCMAGHDHSMPIYTAARISHPYSMYIRILFTGHIYSTNECVCEWALSWHHQFTIPHPVGFNH